MKEFYVMNLDMRRIAIIIGGAMVALGLAIFVGMAIGRGQGERAARMANEDLTQGKLGLTPEPVKNALPNAEKPVLAQGPAAIESVPSVPAVKSEIELREDPLVQGPPRKKKSEKAPVKPARKKKALAKAESEEPEVAGKIEHSTKKSASAVARYTIQVAAFKRPGDASGLIAKLKGEGIKARTEKNGGFFLVTVGRTKSKEKLEKALARLKELEYEAYIRKIKNHSEET